VGGLGGGIVESLGPVMVVILFPQEVIGRAMSAYTFALGAGTVFGPLIAGYMVQDLGSWRYPLYLFGGISALNLFGFVIMFPEPIMNIRVPGDPVMTISEPGSGAEVTDEAKHRSGDSSAGQAECYEGSSPAPSNISASRYALWRRRSFFFKISHQHPVASLWALAVVPYRILAVPAVLLTVLTFGVTISSTIAASILVSMLFSQPPMLWTPAQIGLFNIAPLIGLLTGMVIGGPFADWLSARHYRRHGQFKPEVILPILAPLAIILPIAVTLVGVGFERHWHWAVIGFLWAIINMNLTGGCTVLISYATDIHPRKAIDIGVVVNVFKNAIGAGISFATTEWWFKDQWLMFLTLGMILFVLLLLTAPLYFWGPKIARKTESWLEGYNVD
jgi:MFS family permease